MNLIDLVKGQLTPELMNAASGFLGESSQATTKGFDAAIPSILGGILNNSKNTGVMSQIWDLINSKDNDPGLLNNLGGLFSGSSAASSNTGIGSTLLNLLFGGNNSSILGALTSFAGFKNSGSAGKLLSLASPFILGWLKKKVTSEGFGLSGLTTWLSGNKNDIMSAIPGSMNSALGFSNLGSTSGSTHKAASTASYDNNNGGGGSNWWMWLLGLLAAAEAKAAAEAAAEAAKSMYVGLDSTVRAKWLALGNMMKVTLPDGVEMNVPEKGVEYSLINWLNDASKVVDKTTWFNFDRILFETGKTTLNEASKEQIANIAAVLKAYPNVNIKIGGYTDNVGDAAKNKALSAARAKTVMSALVGLGIESKRLESEGYGQEHPVASNDTAEGRELNRRVAIRVTKK